MKLLLLSFIFIQSVCAQLKVDKPVDISITFGHAPDCLGNSGICTFRVLKKSWINPNKITRFIVYKNELKLVFNKMYLTDKNIKNLLSNKLIKGFYSYVLNEDFVLSNEIKKELKIIKFNKIKKGAYLVRERDNQIMIKLKLE